MRKDWSVQQKNTFFFVCNTPFGSFINPLLTASSKANLRHMLLKQTTDNSTTRMQKFASLAWYDRSLSLSSALRQKPVNLFLQQGLFILLPMC